MPRVCVFFATASFAAAALSLADAARTRSHIKVVPQCALNAYLVRPRLASGPSAKVAARAAYQPGDFVVHLAGHKGENKGALLDYALKHLARAPPQGAPKCGVT